MAQEQLRYAKPTIKLYASQNSDTGYKALLCGMEEEGIPFEIEPADGNSASALAYAASSESRLGVGLGVSKSEIALHYEKLTQGAPLFLIPAEAGAARLRALGANAARLVKKLPFKPL